jgi:hypothetical protein
MFYLSQTESASDKCYQHRLHIPDPTVVSSASDYLMPGLYLELLSQMPGQENEWSDIESVHLLLRWEPERV